MAETWFAWLVGDGTACMKHMNAGLELAKATGVHIWEHLTIVHGVSGALTGATWRSPAAPRTLERDLARARDMDRLYYYNARAGSRCCKATSRAHAFQEQALESAERTGIVFGRAHARFGLALVLHDADDRALAAQHVAARNAWRARARRRDGGALRSRGSGVRARRRRPERGLDALRRGLSLARKFGY